MSLFGALAKGANFHGANLTAADLESTDLEGADLTDAVLEGAQVSQPVKAARPSRQSRPALAATTSATSASGLELGQHHKFLGWQQHGGFCHDVRHYLLGRQQQGSPCRIGHLAYVASSSSAASATLCPFLQAN